jgi:hypothetical protein
MNSNNNNEQCECHFVSQISYCNLGILTDKCHFLYDCWYYYYLQAGRSGYRIPVGARFSAPIQTGPGTHPASYTMGTGSFPEVKRLGVDHPTPSSAKVKERVELYLYSPSGPSWPVTGCTLPLPLHFNKFPLALLVLNKSFKLVSLKTFVY